MYDAREARARAPLDLTLYLVVDPRLCGGRAPLDVVEAAVAGGATIVQLRDNDSTTRRQIDEACRLKAWLEPRGVPLLINDRVDVALAAQADGVHLGQDDMAPADARRLLGPDAVVGLTVRALAQAREVPASVVDYVSIGGVFPTASKDNPDPPIGLKGLRRLAAEVELPRVAISGIGTANAAEVISAGVDGVAVISAVCAAPDARAAAADLKAIVERALRSKVPA
ncbi:MAG: thiamine phosphate synthase [Alphaproteobacteria bacterium]